MKRFLLCAPVTAALLIALGGSALAQEKPEFKLGFAALAADIPGIVGTPLEAEHHDPNGDSLQQTSSGLMVWRKVDNWTAFTDGSRSWVNGPHGLQERSNEERFAWETPAGPAAAPPTPTATAAPTAPPTTAPSPTTAPKPRLRASEPHMIQGQELESGSVWVLGEVSNVGDTPAYNVTATARLLTAAGGVAGTANQLFAYLGPGETVGYRIEVRGATGYERADLALDASSSRFATFTALPVTWVKNEKVVDGQSDVRYEFTGEVKNGGNQPVALSAVYVWFLDDQDRVIWVDHTYIPNALSPGDSYTITARTPWNSANPQVSGLTQVRYYAAGRLP